MMKLILLILFISVSSSCFNNKQKPIQSENNFQNLNPSARIIDSSECLEVYGVGAGCDSFFLVCPDDQLYATTVLLKYINENLSPGTQKIPESCCSRFDTLSLEKKIYLLSICYGGSYTEAWVYMLNEEGKFDLKHYWEEHSMKLDSKTNEVYDFVTYYPNVQYETTLSAAIMKFNGQAFDTFKMVSKKELNDPRWR